MTDGRPVVLIIRDGWGVSPDPPSMAEAQGNAAVLANTPVHDRLLTEYPSSLLTTSGEAVGLPPGQMGNSEVGHLNLGAGRIVYQDFTRISRAIEDGSFFGAPAFADLTTHLRRSGGRLHVIGLASDGGVHSHLDHLFAVLEFARRNGLEQAFIHCFTDGRDTSPNGGEDYVRRIEEHAANLGIGTIASIVGRYFAMDRDQNWDRVQKACSALVNGEGVRCDGPVAAMQQWYADGKTDEFIPATIIRNPGLNLEEQCIRDGDGVVFINFRADRARELTEALTDGSFDRFEQVSLDEVHFVCMTEYDETYDLPIAFPPDPFTNTFAQVIAENGMKQLRIAETEKYAHVTFFFNGGVEEPVLGEDRCLVPSPKVATYDLQPEMSAPEVTRELVARLRSGDYDVVIVNYANPDMVGHSGNVPATVKAVEVIDSCVGEVVAAVLDVGGVLLITADHGNAERLLNERGETFTAHTTNPVHGLYVGGDHQRWNLRSGILADVAPTMLQLLGLAVPEEMTGKSLLVAKPP
jgi:2,3-bisphosphoglycerate-independent phosphoglycerate mutase